MNYCKQPPPTLMWCTQCSPHNSSGAPPIIVVPPPSILAVMVPDRG